MRRFLYAALFTFVVFFAVSAQSGRRVKTQRVLTPVTTPVIDENVYSESRPFKPVRLFPGRNKKKKQAKKAEINETRSSNDIDGEDEIISVESSLVTIPVSVVDSNGIYIPHIKKEEFKVFEDGKEQEIAYFGANDQPFTVALVIDTSGSTQFKIEDIQYAAKLFVRQLEERDKIIVVSFSNSIRVRAEATNDKQTLDGAIEKTSFGGGTSLYDTVKFVLEKRMNKIRGKKAIVLFTDGVDTSSRSAGYQGNLKDAEESDTIIYPVFYNTFLAGRTSGTILNSPFPTLGGGGMKDAKEQTRGKLFLDDLAAYTGGRVFDAGRSRTLLVQAFRGIAAELRAQYNIGYSPINIGEQGDRKKIKVRVYRPNLRVRARDSYIVGEAQTSGDNN